MASSGGAIGFASATDPKAYPATGDFTRALRVTNDPDKYFLSQLGRLQYRDDFNATALQWVNAGVGTVAFDTTTCLTGTQSAKLTTTGGAGNQTIMRKFTTLCADQGFQPTPLVILEAWFKPFDTNIRDVQMFIRLDDSVFKYEAALRFFYQSVGVSQNALQYLNSAGSFITVDTYALPVPTGAVSDPWHHAVLALNYKQGAGGYCNVAAMQWDDFSYVPASPGVAAHTITTNSVRESNLDIIVSCDNATATVCNVDEVRFSDLSGLQNIQVPAE